MRILFARCSRTETALILRAAPQLDRESGFDFGVGKFESDVEHALGDAAATTEQLVAEVAERNSQRERGHRQQARSVQGPGDLAW